MKRIVLHALLCIAIAYCLFPFFWTLVTALKAPEEVFSLPVTYLPERMAFENLKNVFHKRPFASYVVNSLVVASAATAITIWFASLIAFRLKRLPIARAAAIQRWFLLGTIVPPAVLAIPFFMIMLKLGLVNHYLGLILPYALLNLPFAVWMLHAAFRQLPRELEEAAEIDGYTPLGRLLGIVYPLCRPSLSVTAVLVFIFCWNEFIIALTLMPSQDRYTVPVGIALLSGASAYEIPWGEINAAVAITTLPVILIMAGLQRWIIEGLTTGGMKG